MDVLDIRDYGPENNRGYRYVLVIIDNFNKFGWKIPLKNKNAQTTKDSLENFWTNSKRKQNLIETDRGRKFLKNIFEKFLKNNDNKHYSRKTSLGSVFAERFNLTIRTLFKRPVFVGGEGKWIDILPKITKQYIGRIHSSTKFTPIQASLKKNEGYVYKKLLDKRNKTKPKYQINALVRAAGLKKTFSKEIQQIGVTNCMKLQKLSRVQYQLIK